VGGRGRRRRAAANQSCSRTLKAMRVPEGLWMVICAGSCLFSWTVGGWLREDRRAGGWWVFRGGRERVSRLFAGNVLSLLLRRKWGVSLSRARRFLPAVSPSAGVASGLGAGVGREGERQRGGEGRARRALAALSLATTHTVQRPSLQVPLHRNVSSWLITASAMVSRLTRACCESADKGSAQKRGGAGARGEKGGCGCTTDAGGVVGERVKGVGREGERRVWGGGALAVRVERLCVCVSGWRERAEKKSVRRRRVAVRADAGQRRHGRRRGRRQPLQAGPTWARPLHNVRPRPEPHYLRHYDLNYLNDRPCAGLPPSQPLARARTGEDNTSLLCRPSF
jgi:hypothetical protein